jgi:alkylation response protein AidB-like acyl-CoA dehydrogenase
VAVINRTSGGDAVPQSGSAVDTILARAEAVAVASAEEAAVVDYDIGFPTQAFDLIAKTGLLAAPLARERGGLGLGSDPGTAQDLLSVLLRIGWGNPSVGRVLEGHVNALHLVEAFGTPEQIGECTRDVVGAGKLFAVWNTEVEDGVKLVPLARGRFRLEGAKIFASGAGHVQRPLVTAALPDGGRQMCLLPIDRLQARLDPLWWQPMGMRASASHRVDFSGIELDDSALLGAPDDYVRQPWFTGGAIRFAAVQLGGATALLDAACAYLRDMGRTENPYQRTRAGAMAIAIAGGELWLRKGADAMDGCLPIRRQ